MALKIIGSGFGRTGTMTMKDALGHLGFGPTHHMTEVMENPEQITHWKKIFSGESVDWNVVYAGYQSQVDWPGAAVWQQALQAFPDAKVIHTERPAEEWWASFSNTIGKFMAHVEEMPMPPQFAEIFSTMKHGFITKTFTDFTDPTAAMAAFKKNSELVRTLVPADRLLVFNVADGWEPLCRFLDVPVPDQPFPHHNHRREFWERLGGEPEFA